MSDYLPIYSDADAPFTLTLTGTVTGGQLVTWAGAAAGTASTNVAGVAGQDGVSGDKITVWGPGKHRGTASGAIAQGDPLCAGAAGKVRAWVTGTDAVASFIGRAMAAAADTAAVSYSLFGV
jgi:hypothetical protein